MTTTMPHDTVFKAVQTGLKKHDTLALTVSNNSLAIKPMGFYARFCHWNDKKFHETRLSEIAKLVAKTLAVQQRLSFADAAEDRNLSTCRKFLKHLKTNGCSTPDVAELKREITAAKLGIQSSVFEKNPGFEHFAEKNHVERYLLHYNHELKVDPDTQDVLLLKDGVYRPWNELYPEIKQWKKSTYSPDQPWIYGPDGLQNINMYDWSELRAYKKGDPADWNHQYVFEFCSCVNPDSALNGNHSWMRLKTPEGDIYSIGLYRPDKPNLSHNFDYPLRIKPGHLMCPDVSEFWNFEIGTVAIAITKEHFLAMKKALEEDKRNNDIVFQLTSDNCVEYNKRIASIAGIDVPTKVHGIKYLLPDFVHKVEKPFRKLPRTIQKIFIAAACVVYNTGQVCLGTTKIDKNLNPGQRAQAIPHMTSIRDIFNMEKAYLNNPNTFARATRDRVNAWREREIKALHNLELDLEEKMARIRAIHFSLPPQWKRMKAEEVTNSPQRH